jgi:hypothetical protein
MNSCSVDSDEAMNQGNEELTLLTSIFKKQ